MDFILTTGWEDGTASLTERLVRELTDGKRVLWLVSGGSNIPHSVQIMRSIPANLTKQLAITLVDERYGAVGHQDSNFTQLLAAGFEPQAATLVPILTANLSLEQTAERYQQLIEKAFAAADCTVAQAGIGDDGHVAGILPNSPAAREPTALAIGYASEPFQRLTLTFPALRRLDVAYAFAFGAAKQQALQQLHDENLPPEQQPAQILKQLAHAYVYNDQVGDTI